MESPNKKRWGTGSCWQYLQNGACSNPKCDPKNAHTHPKLKITPSSSGDGTDLILPELIPEWMEGLKEIGFEEGKSSHMAVIRVQYMKDSHDREEVKANGAFFSPSMKKWYIPAGCDLRKFLKWQLQIYGLNAKIYPERDGVIMLHHEKMAPTSCVEFMLKGGFCWSHLDIVQPKTIGSRLNNDKQTDATQSSFESPSCTKRKNQYTPDGDDEPATKHDRRNVPSLLSKAKTALELCISAGGASHEQQHFNEEIYQVVNSLVSAADPSVSNAGAQNRALDAAGLITSAGKKYSQRCS